MQTDQVVIKDQSILLMDQMALAVLVAEAVAEILMQLHHQRPILIEDKVEMVVVVEVMVAKVEQPAPIQMEPPTVEAAVELVTLPMTHWAALAQ